MEERDSIRELIAKGEASNFTPNQFNELIDRIYFADFPRWERNCLIQYCMDQGRYNNAQIMNKINLLVNG